MKLEDWGIRKEDWGQRKIKVPAGVGSQAPPRRKTKKTTTGGPFSGAQSFNNPPDVLENNSFSR
jgi:hypothetical protein